MGQRPLRIPARPQDLLGRLQAEFLAQHLAAELELAQGLFAPPGVERAGLLVCGGSPAFVPRSQRSFSPVEPDRRDKYSSPALQQIASHAPPC